MTKNLDATLFRREWWGQPAFSQVRKLYGKEAWIDDLDITHELFAHRGCINALSWSRSGELLASGSDDTHVQIHTTTPNFHLNTTIQTGHTANIFSVKFMPYSGDRTILTAAGDCQVKVFDIEYAPKCNDPRYLRRRPLGGFRTARQAYTNGTASNIINPSETTRTYRSHSNRAKRIVTEDSPYLFLTCSEDGDVRQFDIRLPSSEYPRSPRSRNLRNEKHPPLISYKKYNIDLNTISCSINQPHYIALGGDHRYCFLHDRRMTGRDKADERGDPGGSATIEEISAATKCVKRFGPRKRSGDRIAEGTEHITACRISDANPNELLVSWSGDSVYLFDINRAPDALEKTPEKTAQASKGKRVMKDSAGQRSRQSKKRRTGGTSGGSSRSTKVYGSRAARAVTIPKLLVTLRREMFADEHQPTAEDTPEGHRRMAEYFKKKWDQASCTAKILLDRMRQVAPKLDAKVPPEDEPILRDIHQARKKDRQTCITFVQTAGALAKALGGQVLDESARPIPDVDDFDGVAPPPTSDLLAEEDVEHERFGHSLLRVIVTFLLHGREGIEELAFHNTFGNENTTRQERVDQYFDTLSARAFFTSLLAIGGTGRVLFDSGRDALRAFRLFYASIEDGSSISDESRAFWARDVGRALLMKDATDINHLFVQTAFRGAEDLEEQTSDEERESAILTRLLGSASRAVSQAGTSRQDEAGSSAHQENAEASASGTQHDTGTTDPTSQEEHAGPSASERHDNDTSGSDSEDDHSHDNTHQASVEIDEHEEIDDDGFDILEDDGMDDEDVEEDIDDDGLDDDMEEDDGEESTELEDDREEDDEDDEDEDSDEDMFSSSFNLRRRREIDNLESHAPILEYVKIYSGHCNVRTIKDVNFFGLNDEYVVSGSDCGNFFIWEKSTGALKQLLKGDSDTVNVVEGHPFEPRLAVSGIDQTVKIFGPDQVEQAEFRRLSLPTRRNRESDDDSDDSDTEETQPFIPESNEAENAGDYFDIYDMDPDQRLPGYNGVDEDGISRRNLHNAYSIMSRNEQMRESGVGEAVFTRQLFHNLARRMQQNRTIHMQNAGPGGGHASIAGVHPGGVVHIQGDCDIM